MKKDIMHPSRIHDWASGALATVLVCALIECEKQAIADEAELRRLHRQVGYKPPEKGDDNKMS